MKPHALEVERRLLELYSVLDNTCIDNTCI
jgi:hypothetical protein